MWSAPSVSALCVSEILSSLWTRTQSEGKSLWEMLMLHLHKHTQAPGVKSLRWFQRTLLIIREKSYLNTASCQGADQRIFTMRAFLIAVTWQNEQNFLSAFLGVERSVDSSLTPNGAKTPKKINLNKTGQWCYLFINYSTNASKNDPFTLLVFITLVLPLVRVKSSWGTSEVGAQIHVYVRETTR